MTKRAPGPTDRRGAHRSSAENDIPVPDAGGWIPPQAFSTPTRAARRPSRRADAEAGVRLAQRTIRGAKARPVAGAGGWTPSRRPRRRAGRNAPRR